MLTIVALLAGALTAATAPGWSTRPTVACPAAPAVQTPAEPTTIPIEVWSNHIYVKVCVSDHELEFILDTGAGATSLDLNPAKQLGVGLGQTFSVGGAGPGRVSGARVNVATVTLAGTSIAQSVATAIDLSSLPAREGHRMDGILGDDFIGRHVLALDYARSELRVYDRDAFSYNGPGVSVPVTLINLFPHIDADLRLADGTTLHAHCVVDVGSGGSLALTKAFVDENRLRERVSPTIRRTGGGGVGGSTASDIGRLASISIGGIELAHPLVNLFGDS
ncbi:MAG TPA: retropepsin-like aspartic protease, partial [Vicinamibacterales bacterium]|nr:retropepsin-like aspartic protease [Vicinamibacterales bacterium]